MPASAIQQLRIGAKRNPTRHTIKALADFFRVPAGYFVDGAAAERAKAEIGLLAAMRDQDVREVALRAHGLSADSLRMVSAVEDGLRRDRAGQGTRRADRRHTAPGPEPRPLARV